MKRHLEAKHGRRASFLYKGASPKHGQVQLYNDRDTDTNISIDKNVTVT